MLEKKKDKEASEMNYWTNALGDAARMANKDLSDANLCGANLYGAALSNANLQGANLTGADLRGANLRGANLSDADLHYANLRDANLRDANLRGANLRGANLYGANLQGARAVVRLPVGDPRGYDCVVSFGTVYSGCRVLSLDDARTHWGDNYEGDRNIGDRYLAALDWYEAQTH